MRLVPRTVSPSQEPCGPADACTQDVMTQSSSYHVPWGWRFSAFTEEETEGQRRSGHTAVVTKFKPSP